MSYYVPRGGLPAQSEPLKRRAIFTNAYAFIPREVMCDIVTSNFPHWTGARAWILARPLSGFAESFSYYIVELGAGGGSDSPEPDPQAEAVLFVVDGAVQLTINGEPHKLGAGGYAYLPPTAKWTLHNNSKKTATFHWIRKSYEPAEGLKVPEAFVTADSAVKPNPMPDCDGAWATSCFVAPDDLRHDMHVNIVTFQNGGRIPFEETHVMEHGIYVLEGSARYLLNTDWVEVGAGDFMWLRAFCPQACVAMGDAPFRYLLYKDVNRHPNLRLFG